MSHYPAPLRDLFLQLAATDLFKAKWTADIHREWIDALMRNEPQGKRAVQERTRDLMDTATQDSLVAGFEALIETPEDRHALTDAIEGRRDVMVRQSLKDFPD